MGKKKHEYSFSSTYAVLTKSLASQQDTAPLNLLPGGTVAVKITRLCNPESEKGLVRFKGTSLIDGKSVKIKGSFSLTKKVGLVLLTKKHAEHFMALEPEPPLREE